MQPMRKGKYRSVKQGDSWKPGSQNTERKRKRSLTEISQDPPAELLPMNTINQRQQTRFLSEQLYIMNWEASEIIEQESDKFKQWIKESICIRLNIPTMNRDEGASISFLPDGHK